MLAQCVCPHCQKEFIESVQVECLEEQIFESEESAKRYIQKNIIIKTLQSDDISDEFEMD